MDIYAPKLFKGAVEAKIADKVFVAQDYIPYNVLFYVLGPGGDDKTGHWWVAAKGLPEFVNTPFYLGSGNKLVNDNDATESNLTYTLRSVVTARLRQSDHWSAWDVPSRKLCFLKLSK